MEQLRCVRVTGLSLPRKAAFRSHLFLFAHLYLDVCLCLSATGPSHSINALRELRHFVFWIAATRKQCIWNLFDFNQYIHRELVRFFKISAYCEITALQKETSSRVIIPSTVPFVNNNCSITVFWASPETSEKVKPVTSHHQGRTAESRCMEMSFNGEVTMRAQKGDLNR